MCRISFSLALAWVLLGGLFLAPCGVHAQTERSFEERLLRPDRSQQSEFDGQAFRGTSSFEGQTFQSQGESFLSNRRVSTQEYAPKRFLGIPIPWTKDTRVPLTTNPMSDRTFATSASSLVKESPESGRAFLGHADVVTQVRRASSLDGRTARIEGTNQQNLTQQRDPVSVDDLRTLLNKQVPMVNHENGSATP